MQLTSKVGNLITLGELGQLDVIVHGCNCFHTMGAGIAKEIKDRYPTAYSADCSHTTKGDKNKLGGYTWVEVLAHTGLTFIIVNGYTQYNYGKNGPHLNYEAVTSVFKMVKEQFPKLIIGYPRIGAGLAGGDWNRIQEIINEELNGMEHHLITLK